MKIYWVSEHDLSPAQLSAIRKIHGPGVKIVKARETSLSIFNLALYIPKHNDGFVYTDTNVPACIFAALSGLSFGIFQNSPEKRRDGSFKLEATYHVKEGMISLVLENMDPMNFKKGHKPPTLMTMVPTA